MVKNISQRNLARKAFFAGGVLFAKLQPLVGLHNLRIDTKASHGGTNEVTHGPAHFRNEQFLVGQTESANLSFQ